MRLRRLLCLLGRHRWLRVNLGQLELQFYHWVRLVCPHCRKRIWRKRT